MEFGPSHYVSSTDIGAAALLMVGGLHATLSVLIGLDWKETGRRRKLPSGASPGTRASLVAVVALAITAYQLLGKLWDGSFFPGGPDPAAGFGEISAGRWMAASIVLAIFFLGVITTVIIRRAWPASPPYASALEAATRPLQL